MKESLDIIGTIVQARRDNATFIYQEPHHPYFKDLYIDEPIIKNNKLTVFWTLYSQLVLRMVLFVLNSAVERVLKNSLTQQLIISITSHRN